MEHHPVVRRARFDRLAAMPVGTVLNVNVPNRAATRETRQAGPAEFGSVRSRVKHTGDGSLGLAVVLVEGTLPPGSDAALPADNHPIVTPPRSVAEDVDLVFEPV